MQVEFRDCEDRSIKTINAKTEDELVKAFRNLTIEELLKIEKIVLKPENKEEKDTTDLYTDTIIQEIKHLILDLLLKTIEIITEQKTKLKLTT